MLITRWNEASRALPVLALKSNYLDRWPIDCKEKYGWLARQCGLTHAQWKKHSVKAEAMNEFKVNINN